MIETHGLARRFGNMLAVQDLSLSVASGEVFAFLGPNGAGKTTTMRMLACLIAPTSGEAVVAGLRLGSDNDAIRARIGILTESPGLYERLSASENLQFFGRMHGMTVAERDAQVKRYLTLLGLWDRRAEPVGGFSKGMKQKLAIARALLHEPSVLFLDEPTSALDPEAAKLVRDFIAELRVEGRTIFLCTHNLDEAERLADHIGVMKQRLLEVGTAESLRRGLYGRALAVRLRGSAADFTGAVQALPPVKSAVADGARLSIGLDDPDAAAPDVVRALVAAGADILSVSEEKHSLEDVYLNLVHEGAGGAA